MFLIKFTERNRTCCRFLFFANWLQRPFWSCARSIFQRKSLGDEIEWRSVTSRYHGSQISGSQQSFLTETAICIIERLKITQQCSGKSYISYHTCSFFPVKFAGRDLLNSKSFISMATTCLLYCARSCITVILRAEFDATVRLREVIALESQENKKQNKTS